MKRKTIIKICSILLILSLIVLAFPRSTQAFIGTGIFDFFETALSGVEEKAGPIAARIIFIFFTALSGLIALLTSASLLQWIISNPQWVTLNTPLVRSGLYFTTGLVNLAIILFFVVIAITWILKIETFAAKKALTKLILVALLVNFIPVFVGILIDIATFLHKTILTDTDIVYSTFNAIFGGLGQTIAGIGAWIAFLAGIFMIPFIAPFAQYAFVILIATSVVFLPSFLSWFIQILLAFLLSAQFFFLAFIFACRVYVIQFLVILGPVAFLFSVFPQTEKYWKEWLQHLLSWIFFGLIVLLFLVLGLRGAEYLRPPGVIPGIGPSVPLLAWFDLPAFFGYYFFLFVYISIVTWLGKKTAPQLASFMITQGTMFAGMLTGAGAIVGRGMVRSTQRSLAIQKETQEEAKRKKAEGLSLTRAERLALSPLVRKPTGAMRWAHKQITGREVETTTMKEVDRDVDEIKKQYGEDVGGAVAARRVRGKLRLVSAETAAMGYYATKTKGEKGMKEFTPEEQRKIATSLAYYSPDKLEDFRKYNPRLGNLEGARGKAEEEVKERLEGEAKKKGITEKEEMEKYVKENTTATEIDKIENENIKVARLIQVKEAKKGLEDETTKRLVQDDEAAAKWLQTVEKDVKENGRLTTEGGGKTAYMKLMDRVMEAKAIETLKRDDADKFTREGALKNLESMVRHGRYEFVQRLLETHKLDWEEVQGKIETIGLEKVAKINPAILNIPYAPGGRLMGMKPFKKTREEMRDRIVIIRKEEEKRREKEEIPTTRAEIDKIIKEITEKIKGKEEIKRTYGVEPEETGRGGERRE